MDGGGGQAVHRTASEDDDARAEKADAGDDLGRHTRRINLDGAAARTSLNPYLLTRRIRAAAVPTMVCVRMPALLPWSSRSSPISAVNPNATNSSTICRMPCPGHRRTADRLPARDPCEQVNAGVAATTFGAPGVRAGNSSPQHRFAGRFRGLCFCQRQCEGSHRRMITTDTSTSAPCYNLRCGSSSSFSLP